MVPWTSSSFFMRHDEAQAFTAALLATSAALVDRIQEGVVARGFDDVRPTHGYAFVLLSRGGATVTELAAHLGVTKQAASQLVAELVRKGYAERRAHPADARACRIVLTRRGRACTRAAEEAAADAVRTLEKALGTRRIRALAADLVRVAPAGPLRPGAR